MGTNPGTASYSKRQAKRAGGSGGAGGGTEGGQSAGTESPFNQANVNAARTMISQSRTSAMQGLRLRDLPANEIRREARALNDQELSTRISNIQASSLNNSRLQTRVRGLQSNPLPPDVRARLTRENRSLGRSINGLNRYARGLGAEQARRQGATFTQARTTINPGPNQVVRRSIMRTDNNRPSNRVVRPDGGTN
jgi:hypothetical protein